MTRTQITLEEQQYRFLKAQAAEHGASLSSVVRALVRQSMEAEAASSPHIWEVAGLITKSDFTGEGHDAVLYGGGSRIGDREPDQTDA
jgi:plasmid stability protein